MDDGRLEVNPAGFVIHSAIHKARHDVDCVFHTHTRAGVAVSAQAGGLLMLSQHSMRFHNRVGYHGYEGIALDEDEQERLVKDLGPHKVLILRNHGLLTAGATVRDAFEEMYYLELACQIQIDAMSSGAPLSHPPLEVCEHAAVQFANSNSFLKNRDWHALAADARPQGSFVPRVTASKRSRRLDSRGEYGVSGRSACPMEMGPRHCAPMTLPTRHAIDVHSHVVPERFPAWLGSKAPAGWPSMAPAHACHAHVMIDGKVYRTVSDCCWSAARRLADMPAMGVAVQALSPMPELLSYWLAAADARQLLRYINEEIAAMVAESGGRFVGLGAVPLQDVDLAIDELRHAVQTLGFAGVEIGSNVNGVPIGDLRFDPFFEACEALGAAVFVHALKPAGMDRLVGPPPLQQVLAYPSEVGLAAASCITSNLIERRPRLRIAFSHGGGTLAMLLPRLQQGLGVFPR